MQKTGHLSRKIIKGLKFGAQDSLETLRINFEAIYIPEQIGGRVHAFKSILSKNTKKAGRTRLYLKLKTELK